MLVKALDLSGPQFLHPYHSENVPYSNTGPFFFFLNTCEVKKNFFFFISCTKSSLLHRLSFSCGKQRLSCRCDAWTPIAAASLVAEHRLQGMWAQKLWWEGSIVQSPGSQAQAQ